MSKKEMLAELATLGVTDISEDSKSADIEKQLNAARDISSKNLTVKRVTESDEDLIEDGYMLGELVGIAKSDENTAVTQPEVAAEQGKKIEAKKLSSIKADEDGNYHVAFVDRVKCDGIFYEKGFAYTIDSDTFAILSEKGLVTAAE